MIQGLQLEYTGEELYYYFLQELETYKKGELRWREKFDVTGEATYGFIASQIEYYAEKVKLFAEAIVHVNKEQTYLLSVNDLRSIGKI